MTKQQKRLTSAYKKYRRNNITSKGILKFLQTFMPEMIFRTTRLEGEKVNRNTVSSLVKD